MRRSPVNFSVDWQDILHSVLNLNFVYIVFSLTCPQMRPQIGRGDTTSYSLYYQHTLYISCYCCFPYSLYITFIYRTSGCKHVLYKIHKFLVYTNDRELVMLYLLPPIFMYFIVAHSYHKSQCVYLKAWFKQLYLSSIITFQNLKPENLRTNSIFISFQRISCCSLLLFDLIIFFSFLFDFLCRTFSRLIRLHGIWH